MPSGYEKSPDYGGPQPKPWAWLILFVLAVAVIAYVVLT
jgi:hypothetical protein